MDRTLTTPSSPPAGVAVFDAVASKFLATAAPIEFRCAETDLEREAIFRLRYRVVVERGWAPASNFPNGLERDAYDDFALHIGGWCDGELAATGRIVFPRPGRLLPTEHVFGFIVEPRGQVANLDRVAVAPHYSDRRHRVARGLLGAIWQEIRAHGFCRLAGIETRAAIRFYWMVGLHMTEIGPPLEYWGEQRIPVVFDPSTAADSLLKRRSNSG
jgi:N-acyl-L-homoserine lactone synthetase